MKSVILISVCLSLSVRAQFEMKSLLSAPNYIGEFLKPLLSPFMNPLNGRRIEREDKLESHKSEIAPRPKDSSAVIFPGQNDVRDKRKNIILTSAVKDKVVELNSTTTVGQKGTSNKTDKPSLDNRFGSNYVLLPISTLGANQQPAVGGGMQNYQSAGLGVMNTNTNPVYANQNQLISYLQQPQGQVNQFPVYSQPAQTVKSQYVNVPNTGYNSIYMTSQPTAPNYQQVLVPANSGSQPTYYTLVNPNQSNLQTHTPLYYVVNPGSQNQQAMTSSYSYVPSLGSYSYVPASGYTLLANKESDDGDAKVGLRLATSDKPQL